MAKKNKKDNRAYTQDESTYEVASQWQLMLWKFKKHKLANVALPILVIMYLMAIFADFLSEATNEFRQLLITNAGKKGIEYEFKIEEARAYSLETHTTLTASKSLYQPLYVLKDQNGRINFLEKNFISYLSAKRRYRSIRSTDGI